MYRSILFALILLCSGTSAQQVEKSVYGTFALINARIETITDGQIQGAVLIRDGKIAAVGDVEVPGDARVIDCAGLTIYPGLIDGGTRLGLSEVGSISLTQDYNEIGDITPQLKTLTAINPNSVLIPVTRVNGITSVLARPSGGTLPGTACLINLHGYTPDQMYAGYEAVLLNFPVARRSGRRENVSEEDIEKEHEKIIKRLDDIWGEATLYARIREGGGETELEYNPEMEVLSRITTGDLPLLVEVNDKKSILSALQWLKGKEIDVVLTGVRDGWRVADSIAASGIPVITGPVLRLPARSSERYDIAYRNPAIMLKAGVKVAIRTNDTENVRNLPYHAGFAATYGMGREEALKAITIVPAEIFGLGDQIGSIEPGKIANLFVADGDIFETSTQVKHLFIGGWNIPLESRHTLLYDEFLERSPGLKN